MSDQLTIDQVMNAMPGAFLPEKAGDMNAIIQYHLSGDEAGDWVVRIGEGACQVEQGTVEDPPDAGGRFGRLPEGAQR